ncbi:hypothetical protein ABZ401_19115 [Streptomyces sp. NPDC005892]|uniref:hypothetical protein n=1 Tax=Streptomyces sp. NPDC005892 TaxID=3155593 RepID=UPI0033FDA0A8
MPLLRPLRLAVTDRSAAILRRCYRGQMPATVLERALLMLAAADGHLNPDGSIRTRREASR